MKNDGFALHAALLTSAAFLSSASFAPAAAVAVSSYSYVNGPSSLYPDSGGELTNGVTFSRAWSIPATTITPADVVQLSGWRNSNPSIRFNFSTASLVQSLTVWVADSDGSAGVGVPANILLRSLDNTLIRSFSITDPLGNGGTVPLELTGFAVTASSLIVEVQRNFEWTMLSEVQFSSVPEPSSMSIFGLLFASLVLRRKRIS